MFSKKKINFNVVLNHRNEERVTRRFTLVVGPLGSSVTVIPDVGPAIRVAPENDTVILEIPFTMMMRDMS